MKGWRCEGRAGSSPMHPSEPQSSLPCTIPRRVDHPVDEGGRLVKNSHPASDSSLPVSLAAPAACFNDHPPLPPPFAQDSAFIGPSLLSPPLLHRVRSLVVLSLVSFTELRGPSAHWRLTSMPEVGLVSRQSAAKHFACAPSGACRCQARPAGHYGDTSGMCVGVHAHPRSAHFHAKVSGFR